MTHHLIPGWAEFVPGIVRVLPDYDGSLAVWRLLAQSRYEGGVVWENIVTGRRKAVQR